MQNGFKNISDFFQHYQTFAFEKDIPGMINLYDDQVLVFDMWGKGYIPGLKEWSVSITGWLSSLKDESVKVEFTMIDIHEDDRVGFANAIIQFQAITGDGLVIRSMKNRISLGFTKQDGSWKVKHQHTSAPINGGLQAILDI